MAHKDNIISYITQHKGLYCDDCLSKLCNITPRQTVFQVCSKLDLERKINRTVGFCSYCGKEKKINSSMLDNEYYKNINIVKQINTKKINSKTIKEDKNTFYKSNEFIKIGIDFESFNIENTFARFKAYSLSQILSKDKYKKLKDECYTYHGEHMGMELGMFLNKLKQNNNTLYKKFLNPYGDELYCKFKMKHTTFEKCKGLYMYKYDDRIKYIGRVKGNYNFYQRINMGYANISPKNCYIDGRATNCHINSLINKVRGQVEFYIMPLENDEAICSLERQLIKEYQPEWNIALK